MYGGWYWGDEQESKPVEQTAKVDIEKYKNKVFAIPGNFNKWQIKTIHPYIDALTFVNIMDKTDTKEYTMKFFMENIKEVWW